MSPDRDANAGTAVAVAIRADASRAIGWGHVKRCLALAQALKAEGAMPRLVARRSDITIDALCAQAGVPLVELPAAVGPVSPTEDATLTIAALHGEPTPLVIVDHYGLDVRWHEALRASGAHIAVIDDLADRPLSPDWLIDHNPAACHQVKYAAVLRRSCTVLGGPRFALLDAAYARQPRPAFSATVRSIGIFLGGTDAGGFSALAWRACRAAGFTGAIEIATTRGNPHLAALQSLRAEDEHLTLTLDQPHLAAFHARHDLHIGAGGGASWERCCLGVPTIALICADNQRHAVLPLIGAGLVLGLDMTASTEADHLRALTAAVHTLVHDAPQRKRQSELGRHWVDGLGASRVARTLLHTLVSTWPAAVAR